MKELSTEDIKSGGWFTKRIAQSLRTYTERVDWRYFQDRHKGLPPDAIVEQRIKMASRYPRSRAVSPLAAVVSDRRRHGARRPGRLELGGRGCSPSATEEVDRGAWLPRARP